MTELLAERFVAVQDAWVDLASGSTVQLRVLPAGDRSAQMAWSETCGDLSRLRHPLINSLVDFGFADRHHTFEAYAVRGPLVAPGAVASNMLTHAVRFLQSQRVRLTSGRAHLAMREISRIHQDRIQDPIQDDEGRLARRVRGSRRYRQAKRRPLGIVLQPRPVVARITEALEEAGEGGPAAIRVAGPPGSGLRTVRTLAARAARLAGYVPVASGALLRLPTVLECIGTRTLCLLVDDHSAAERLAVASLLARLGTASARRHTVLTFLRTDGRAPNALEIEPMSVSALTSMVVVDRDCGPTTDELQSAAQGAEGRPAVFLDLLRAASFEDRVSRLALVHESSPAYVLRPPSRRRIQGVGRALLNARDRAARLAGRGRHASAVRLLTRASRVLQARGERALAGACEEALAWIERNRGHSDRALQAFDRARDLGRNEALAVRAAIGVGIVWTDEQRFAEAEAALRAACGAAALVADAGLGRQARRGLARCLFWQSRVEEALALLTSDLDADERDSRDAASRHDEGHVATWALAARLKAQAGDLRGAVAAAGRAARIAEQLGTARASAVAARGMAVVHAALGDGEQVCRAVERGLEAASAAHLPILGLKLRGLRAGVLADRDRSGAGTFVGHVRAALRDRVLPPLVRGELEAACDAARRASTGTPAAAAPEDLALRDLQVLLALVHAASEDREGLESLCRSLCEQLRAATIQIVTGGREPRTLARAGRPWSGDTRIIERALVGGMASSVAESPEPRQSAEAIRYADEPIAVLSARWTAGVALDPRRVSALMRAAALAAAAPVRSILDRAPAPSPQIVCADLIGSSAAANALRDAVARAARAPFPVLVEGESGTGKELVARGIHRQGARRDRRLCTVNCAALSDELLEAELFGHARGAFTGAVGERAGLFEEADGGTLFLDEVGELSPRAQAKLLRVLQDGEVRRVGENLPRRVDTRIVAATNRRLDEEVAAGRFRADLRFRLDVVRIPVPPLRERATDIPALAMQFWTEATARVGSAATLSAETLAALARYDWPGNVRELQNAVASLAVHAPRRGRVLPSMLPAHIAGYASPGSATFESARFEFERRYVRAALAQAGGQRSRAARALGVSRQGLAKMLSRLRIEG